LGVLPFLTQIVRVYNQSHVSEASLLWLLEDFIRSPAKEAFRLQSLETWPSAVHWLLTSYAPETTIEAAVRSLQTTTQNDPPRLFVILVYECNKKLAYSGPSYRCPS
jgi:hypothetical protein